MNRNKRLTKTEKYAKHGILFDKDTNKIFCEPLNIWINLLMPVGTNNKVGKAGTWSMLHGNETITIDEMHEKMQDVMKLANLNVITLPCPVHCPGCYCDNGCFNWPQNKALNLMKLILARFYMNWLEKALTAQIDVEHLTQVRIHVAGDFFSIEYVEMWARIANRFTDTCIFWTYTKVKAALDILESVKNIFIVPSMTPFGFNFGTCAELIDRYNKLVKLGYRVHICACGTDYEKHCSDCKHGCKAVGIECDYVLFIKHSTSDYKAGKDDPEEFKKVCDIIVSQNN